MNWATGRVDATLILHFTWPANTYHIVILSAFGIYNSTLFIALCIFILEYIDQIFYYTNYLILHNEKEFIYGHQKADRQAIGGCRHYYRQDPGTGTENSKRKRQALRGAPREMGIVD